MPARGGDQMLKEKIYPKLDSGSSPVAPFLQHRVPSPARGLRFCPFQDVLGAGHGMGLSSILVPGSGEPNLDAEQNPFRSCRQRQEWEVKALLEKIPAELLTPEPALLSRVDTAGLEQKHQERVQRLGFDPTSKPKFRPRRRHRGRAPELRRRSGSTRRPGPGSGRVWSRRRRRKTRKNPPKKEEKRGKTPQKSGNKLGENLQKPANKKGENPPKKGKKLGEKLQKVGEKTPKNQEKGEGNAQKIGKKLGKKTPKIGQKNGEKAK
ncbi:LOW QUALITY PROTEIN: WD repeat-containing protein 46 [Ammospiza maritima maritima]